MSAASWHKKVQYRHTCDGCGEPHLCAVIRRKGGRRTLRLCLSCYEDGHWRRDSEQIRMRTV